jgi:hypothetical protein
LERTNKKFIKRFQYLEIKTGELGKPLMDVLKWMFLGRGEASGKKERNKKILIFKYSRAHEGLLAKKEE